MIRHLRKDCEEYIDEYNYAPSFVFYRHKGYSSGGDYINKYILYLRDSYLRKLQNADTI